MGVGMGVAVAEKAKGVKTNEEERRKRLLKLLTYEVVDGKPIYYRGYKEVLAGRKTPEEVMGASFFHADLVGALVWFLRDRLGGKYRVVAGELGYFVGKGWRNLDVAVFRYEDVKDKLESESYIDVAPVLVFEINIRAEVESEMEYVLRKSEDLLKSGVEKVVWIFTKSKKMMVFERGKRGVILDWEDEIPLIEGLKLNLPALLKRP